MAMQFLIALIAAAARISFVSTLAPPKSASISVPSMCPSHSSIRAQLIKMLPKPFRKLRVNLCKFYDGDWHEARPFENPPLAQPISRN